MNLEKKKSNLRVEYIDLSSVSGIIKDSKIEKQKLSINKKQQKQQKAQPKITLKHSTRLHSKFIFI